jgi:hypothetical protein
MKLVPLIRQFLSVHKVNIEFTCCECKITQKLLRFYVNENTYLFVFI